ncbi:MAG: hypothetical protein ACYDB7_04600 [Mycobacteriales bacterium]
MDRGSWPAFRAGKWWRSRGLVLLASAVVVASAPVAWAGPGAHGAHGAHGRHGASTAPVFYVGAAQRSITPTSLAGMYLGGYGIGPMHPASGILRPIYVHAMAIRAGAQTVVFAALDVQGHFAAYQQGPYGFSDMRADLQRRLHIPAAQIVLSSTHTHNGPDDLGVWGGVPTSYLAFVKGQTEAAVEAAVAAEQPATLHWGQINATGFCGTFPNNGTTADQSTYPIDNQLRVLQARSPATGRVVATMVNFSCHATVYGPLNKVSPDWPGATVAYLEHAEAGARGSYGFPGSQALVMVGAVGHTWPVGVPAAFADPRVDPPQSDNNYPADRFGNGVARAAIAALDDAHPVGPATVAGAASTVSVVNDNPYLLAMITAPVPGWHIDRANTPPYAYGDVYVAPVGVVRIGGLAFFTMPGEGYPSLFAALSAHVRAAGTFVFSLAQDQLGYISMPSELAGQAECSPDDEFFFTISPTFGVQVRQAEEQLAAQLGFPVSPDPLPGQASPLPLSLSTSCLTGQLP